MRLLLAPFMRWLSRLSHPRLFMVLGALFLLDSFTPDLIPFLDEMVLGAATMVFANWKKRGAPETPDAGARPPIDGTARRR